MGDDFGTILRGNELYFVDGQVSDSICQYVGLCGKFNAIVGLNQNKHILEMIGIRHGNPSIL